MTVKKLREYRSLCAELDEPGTPADRKAYIVAQMDDVATFVGGIEDSFTRRVFTARYIAPTKSGRMPTWERVGEQLHASGSYCAHKHSELMRGYADTKSKV